MENKEPQKELCCKVVAMHLIYEENDNDAHVEV